MLMFSRVDSGIRPGSRISGPVPLLRNIGYLSQRVHRNSFDMVPDPRERILCYAGIDTKIGYTQKGAGPKGADR